MGITDAIPLITGDQHAIAQSVKSSLGADNVFARKFFPLLLNALCARYEPIWFESINAHVIPNPLPFDQPTSLEDALNTTKEFASRLEGRVVGGIEVENAIPMTLPQYLKVHAEARHYALQSVLPMFEERNNRSYFSSWILDFLNKMPDSERRSADLRHMMYTQAKAAPMLLGTSYRINGKELISKPYSYDVYDAKKRQVVAQHEVHEGVWYSVRVEVGNVCYRNLLIPSWLPFIERRSANTEFFASEFDAHTGMPISASVDVNIYICGGTLPAYSRGDARVSLFVKIPKINSANSDGNTDDEDQCCDADNNVGSRGIHNPRSFGPYGVMARFNSLTRDCIDLTPLLSEKKSGFSVPIMLYAKK